MTEEKNPQNDLDQLRAGGLEAAPTMGQGAKVGKEIKVRRSPWVLRSAIILLAFLLVAEGYFIVQFRQEILNITISNPPPVQSYPAPDIGAEAAPPVEAAIDSDFAEEPDPIPLPDELQGIEIEYPEIEE